MTKTVRVTFDGKTYVPADSAEVADIPVGARGVIHIETEGDTIPIGTRAVAHVEFDEVGGSKAEKQRILNAIRGKMSSEEAERRLKELYERREADINSYRDET